MGLANSWYWVDGVASNYYATKTARDKTARRASLLSARALGVCLAWNSDGDVSSRSLPHHPDFTV